MNGADDLTVTIRPADAVSVPKSAIDWTDGAKGWLPVGGAQLECAFHGPSPDQAPTVLYLHEGLGCVELWHDVPRQMAELTGCGGFVFSRRGHGRSDPAARMRTLDYIAHEAQEVLPQVLDGIGAQRVVLLGHSDGASIAATYAALQDDPRICGMVLIAPHFFVEQQCLQGITAMTERFERADLRMQLGRYHNQPARMFRNWRDCWTNPDDATWQMADTLKDISVPVLAVQGKADPYGTLSQIGVLAARSSVPVETLVLPETGHAPHLERADLVLPRIAEFVHNMV